MGEKCGLAEPSDLELLEASRDGSAAAFGTLWKRHADAILSAIRSHTNLDANDVVQEAFLRIWQQLKSGNGPQTSFRAYAVTTARSVASTMGKRRSSTEITGLPEDLLDHITLEADDPGEQIQADGFTASVFGSLPPRWQTALWYRDVEGLSITEISSCLGIGENATSALLGRAREGFKQAWILAHLDIDAACSAECLWVIERLPQHSRGRGSAAVRQRVDAHLSECAQCTRSAREANRLKRRLALILLPLLLSDPGPLAHSPQPDTTVEHPPTDEIAVVASETQVLGSARLSRGPLTLLASAATVCALTVGFVASSPSDKQRTEITALHLSSASLER
ncbi:MULTISPECIES: RNA polymerase sigma factor [unclassified Leucobacter]|uniref:RNA polymerase sigma factor n=1 Tax=unclassified Leucobacter TaxID=2621730 RepID=UPI003016FCCA